MSTLLELKTRIRLETNKDDIASGGEAEAALTTAITRAIEFYADRDFWFNHASGTRTTTASVAYVALPATVRVAETVSYSGVPLQKVPLARIEYGTATGQPSYWAEAGDNIQLYPIPNTTYALSIFGTAEIGIPASDGASNAWTEDAVDLIAARARMLLCRDLWRDAEGAQLAALAEQEALDALLKATRRRGVTPLRSRGDEPYYPQRFDITRG